MMKKFARFSPVRKSEEIMRRGPDILKPERGRLNDEGFGMCGTPEGPWWHNAGGIKATGEYRDQDILWRTRGTIRIGLIFVAFYETCESVE
jgi:hypothetical protein